jgi:hypothetical protein
MPRTIEIPRSDSQDVRLERRAIRAMRPAMARAIEAMREQIDEKAKLIRAGSAPFTILADLDWAPFKKVLADAWQPQADREMRIARRDARRAVAAASKRVTIGNDDVLVASWARSNALDLAEQVTIGSVAALKARIAKAIERNESIDELIRATRDYVGLTNRDIGAVDKAVERWRRTGELSDAQLRKRTQRYADKLLRRRAENIARTEMKFARNRAIHDSWQEALDGGDLPADVKRVWIERGGCPICVELGAHPPIALTESWQSPIGEIYDPPAHPSCRCSQALRIP